MNTFDHNNDLTSLIEKNIAQLQWKKKRLFILPLFHEKDVLRSQTMTLVYFSVLTFKVLI